MRRGRLAGAALVLATMVLALGCGDDPTSPVGLMPDFSLVDGNPNSPTYQATHSPRQYLGQISAWYFGHAT